MAFDPLQEDCHRLILHTMRRNHVHLTDSAFVGRCMELYEQDPNALIATDQDRSFHLVAQVTTLVDYTIPFTPDDTQAEAQAKQAENMIAEAVSLDPESWDAKRVQAALQSRTNEDYVSFLMENLNAVEEDTARTCASTATAYDREYAGDLARRPYARWLGAAASRQLVAGRYRASLSLAEKCLSFDPADQGDVRYTALLAASKLEYSPEELKRFRGRHSLAFRQPLRPRRRIQMKDTDDAWSLIAELNARYRSFDYDGADTTLKRLIKSYLHAAEALYFQAEFPDGIFARVNVEPGSTDELVLAVSEATPLLQEGLGAPENAGFAAWLANHKLVEEGLDRKLVRSIERQRNLNAGEGPWEGGEGPLAGGFGNWSNQ